MPTPAVARRTRPADPPGAGRRVELAAGLATAAVVAQFVLAPATLVIAVMMIAVGRASRWRPHWLLLPALAGLGWLLASGAALTFVPLPQVARWSGPVLPSGLVRQLPLALLVGSAEAALVLWPAWWRSSAAWRPGLVAALRARATARALPAGHTVAPDGFGLGLATGTGKLATVTWTEAERGVLLTGQDGARLGELALAAACAAMRLRKTVLILDLARVATAATELARSLGIPVSELSAVGQMPAAATELGRAIRHRSVVVCRAAVHAEMSGVLEGLREHGLRADCLAWISGAERLEPASVDRLLELARATGTALLLSSTSEACAAALAAKVQVVTAEGPITRSLALQLASQSPEFPRDAGRTSAVGTNLAGQSAGEFTMLGRGMTAPGHATIPPFVTPKCLLVPVAQDAKP